MDAQEEKKQYREVEPRACTEITLSGIGEEEENCGWNDLPIEIQDIILCHVVHLDNEDGRWLVMEDVLSLVCRSWRERKPG